jgi:hypothetical protein
MDCNGREAATPHSPSPATKQSKGEEMIRNLKALGLALVAVFAMSVVVASAASASEFTGLNGKGAHEGGTFSGTQTATHLFNATGSSEFGQVTCETATFAGTSANGTDTNPTVTPTYEKCHVVLGSTKFPVDVRTNGCTYKFSITGGSEDKFTGTAAVECPTASPIEVEVTTAGGGTKKCLDTIGPQSGLNNVTYENNTAAGDLVVKTETNNVVNTTSGGLLNCGVSNGEHKTGSYQGSTTVSATGGEGALKLTVM